MRRRVKNYRGARSGLAGVAIPVLIVLCIIAAGVLYFVNDNSVFTKEGDAVVATKENVPEEKSPDVSDVIIEQVEGPEKETNITDADNVKEKTEAVRALFIGISDVKDSVRFSGKLEEAKNSGANTVVLEVKAEDGTLAFTTDHSFVADKQLSGEDELLKKAISEARENGFSVALYISCFKDNGAAHSNFENAVIQKDNGWVWRDDSDSRWLSAYSTGSQEYITGIIEKLAGFVPDEIILANVSFPATGNIGSIDYGENAAQKAEVISAFAEKAIKAAGNVSVSAVYENYDANRLPGSGQDIGTFKRWFKALYVARDGGKNTLSFDTARTAAADDAYMLIPVAPSFDAGADSFMIRK